MIVHDWLGQPITIGTKVLYAISDSHFAKLVYGEVTEITNDGEATKYSAQSSGPYSFRTFKLKVRPIFENVDILGEGHAYGRGVLAEYGGGEKPTVHTRVEAKPVTIKNVEKVTVFAIPESFVNAALAKIDLAIERRNEHSRAWAANDRRA